MLRREPFMNILVDTLADGWSEQYNAPVAIYPGGDGAVEWRVQPLLNGIFVPEIDAVPRRFLRDSFTFTPVTWRMPAQYLLGRFLSSTVGLHLSSHFAFSSSCRLPDQESLLVMPGNRRIRVFNFKSGTCRVFLKSGFDSGTMLREIEIRGSSDGGPFPLLSAWHENGKWFEEPIIEGYALVMCPPWIERHSIEHRAFEDLEKWCKITMKRVKVGEYLEPLLRGLHHDGTEIKRLYGPKDALPPDTWFDVLCAQAIRFDYTETSMTHGDFQGGNILIDRRGSHIFLIDWEYCGRRFIHYDRFVYGLGSRSPRGLSGRVRRFLNFEASPWPLAILPKDRSWRRWALALFLLEDLAWYMRESVTGPFTNVSEGLQIYIAELNLLGPSLHALFDE